MMNRSITTIFFVIFFLCIQACLPINQDKNMDVVSIKKIIDKSTVDYTICSSLYLTKRDVLMYFTHADQVNDYEFNSEAIILPCKYEGAINIGNDLYQWEIIAGGAGYLYNKSNNKRFLCKDKCSKVLSKLK
jgi:hypothetical protein